MILEKSVRSTNKDGQFTPPGSTVRHLNVYVGLWPVPTRSKVDITTSFATTTRRSPSSQRPMSPQLWLFCHKEEDTGRGWTGRGRDEAGLAAMVAAAVAAAAPAAASPA